MIEDNSIFGKLFGDLDADIAMITQQNATMQQSAATRLGTLVGNELRVVEQESAFEAAMAQGAAIWTEVYGRELWDPEHQPPRDLQDIPAEFQEEWRHKFDRFQDAYEAFEAVGLTNDGELLTKQLRVVLVPWKYFADTLVGCTVDGWFSLRSLQHDHQLGSEPIANTVNPDMRALLRGDGGTCLVPGKTTTFVSAEKYLAQRMEKDGNWGAMLMQVSAKPGIDDQGWKNKSAEETIGLRAADQLIEPMSIFEWLALTLQCPVELNEPSYSQSSGHPETWLAGNRIPVVDWDGNKRLDVPHAFWSMTSSRVFLKPPNEYDNVFPRVVIS